MSPVKIKEKGEWVETPAFYAVMRSVVRRLRLMSQVHGGGEWLQAGYGPLLDLAEAVQLALAGLGPVQAAQTEGHHGDIGEIETFATVPVDPGFPEGVVVHGNRVFVSGPARFGTAGTGPSAIQVTTARTAH